MPQIDTLFPSGCQYQVSTVCENRQIHIVGPLLHYRLNQQRSDCDPFSSVIGRGPIDVKPNGLSGPERLRKGTTPARIKTSEVCFRSLGFQANLAGLVLIDLLARPSARIRSVIGIQPPRRRLRPQIAARPSRASAPGAGVAIAMLEVSPTVSPAETVNSRSIP